MVDITNIETSDTKTRVSLRPIEKLFHFLGGHKWENMYSNIFYRNGRKYGFPWNQYCLYCDKERENPAMGR